MTNRRERILAVLTETFAPEALDVEDVSAAHAGHAGARPEGETHFNVRIVAAAFNGTSRVTAHRAVSEALSAEFEAGLHALSISARAP